MDFDLKGSIVHRHVKVNDKKIAKRFRQVKKSKLPLAKNVLKDVNFIRIGEHFKDQLIDIPDSKGSALIKTMIQDAQFLKNKNIMDYSLFISIEANKAGYIAKRNTELSRNRHLIYHFGIIDYLQKWDMTKKAEATWKTFMRGNKKQLISAVNSNSYYSRFVDFLQIQVFDVSLDCQSLFITGSSILEILR